MKKLLTALLLISSTSYAKQINGHFELSKYINSNIPAYNDYTGLDAIYGLDLELNFPTGLVWDRLDIMAGADARGADQGFTQAAGRCGISLDLDFGWQLGLYHRSTHNFDYQSEPGTPKFYSDNRFFIRYNFGIR
jgi:hypothetical protein